MTLKSFLTFNILLFKILIIYMCQSKRCEYVELYEYKGYKKIIHYHTKNNKLIPFFIQYI
jgi:hypothetical protein